MANKIYLGEIEVANTGGGGGGEGYVSDASFNEMTKVAASALLDLKGLEDSIEEFDEKIEGHVEIIDTQIQDLQTSKADSSTVYDKSERDKTDKVAAAAISSLDGRVSALEQGGGGGGGITPAQLDASLREYTYDKAHLDSSYVYLKNRDKIYEGINPRNSNKYLYPYYSKLPGNATGDYSYVNCPDNQYGYSQYTIETGYGCHVEGLAGLVNGKFAYGFGVLTRTSHFGEFSCGTFNISRGYETPTYDVVDSSTHSLFNVGNGIQNKAHNGFEIRRSGDIYIPDVSAAGEYYEKPMINLQQKLYELEARLAALENS